VNSLFGLDVPFLRRGGNYFSHFLSEKRSIVRDTVQPKCCHFAFAFDVKLAALTDCETRAGLKALTKQIRRALG
jgi:hypothetical protein